MAHINIAHIDTTANCGPVRFQVTLRDGTIERVDGADAYAQEQSMTTFFSTEGRRTVDCWSVRIASIRTDQILAVRRLELTGQAPMVQEQALTA